MFFTKGGWSSLPRGRSYLQLEKLQLEKIKTKKLKRLCTIPKVKTKKLQMKVFQFHT